MPVVKTVRPVEVDKKAAVAVNPDAMADAMAVPPPIAAVAVATEDRRVVAAGSNTGAMNEEVKE